MGFEAAGLLTREGMGFHVKGWFSLISEGVKGVRFTRTLVDKIKKYNQKSFRGNSVHVEGLIHHRMRILVDWREPVWEAILGEIRFPPQRSVAPV